MFGLTRMRIAAPAALLLAGFPARHAAAPAPRCTSMTWEHVDADSTAHPMRVTFRSGAECPDLGQVRLYSADRWIDVPLARLWILGDSLRFATTAGSAPMEFAGRGEAEQLDGELREGGRRTAITFRRVHDGATDAP